MISFTETFLSKTQIKIIFFQYLQWYSHLFIPRINTNDDCTFYIFEEYSLVCDFFGIFQYVLLVYRERERGAK